MIGKIINSDYKGSESSSINGENGMKLFQSPEFGQVRTAMNGSEVLFAATDVAKCLGYANPQQAIRQHCKEQGVTKISTPTENQHGAVVMQEMKFITKGNVIRLVANSTLPQAEKVESWIFDEVIPSVLETGGYIATKQDDTPEEIMARALMIAQDTITKRNERIKQLETDNQRQQVLIKQKDEEAKENAPKVLFANAVSTSHRSCLVAELTKILQQNGVNIGQNRLFAWMRENGYLCSKGQYYNQPTQKAMELGLFELKQTSITKPDGTVLVTTTTKVTGKGQVYFVNKFLGNAA